MSDSVENQTHIDISELRAVTRLLGEIAHLDAPLDVKRRRLIEGLCGHIDADGWVWTIGRVDTDRHSAMSMGYLYGGLSDKQAAALLDATADTSEPSPEDFPLASLVAEGKHFTRTRRQLTDDQTWYASRKIKTYYLNRGIDHTMYAITPLADGTFSGIGFFRAIGREPFTERQRRIAHIVTTEVRWLCNPDLPPAYGRELEGLTPRLRTVLTMLLDGSSCEEIADLLCLSPHTVKGYIKQIYRHFDVRSQPKLIQRFRTDA